MTSEHEGRADFQEDPRPRFIVLRISCTSSISALSPSIKLTACWNILSGQ